MIYKVNVENPCRCFNRHGLMQEQEFKTKVEAQKEAEEMLEYMEKNFCHLHSFKLIERADKMGYKIEISKI